ncbi:hypothetical protein PHYC_01433 [Phycisphaerales bacterium]|nr:hypothetical protein PHYC_01433 [Phycisphaerales bacterium]
MRTQEQIVTYRAATTSKAGRWAPPSRWFARMTIAALAAAVGGLSPLALAQPATPEAKAQEADRQRLLSDFVHYVRIQRYDLAQAMAQSIRDLKLSDREFVDLVERSGDLGRVEDAWQRAMRVPELQDAAAFMTHAFNSGKLGRARDPQEIGKSIEALTGTLRGKLLARERLLAAGEYAMPQLLNALLDRQNAERRAEVQRVVVEMGRQAVVPMCVALMTLPPAHQELVADVLGRMNWRSSLPYLVDLRGTTPSAPVREACDRAIERLGGVNGSASDLYRELAESYYAEKPETISFPGESHQLLWTFEPAGGLTMTAIRTPVFHEARAMELCERSMQGENSGGAVSVESLALWVASNYSREIDTPAGYTNPAYAAGRRTADYYGVAAGADVAQRVLTRALDARDTPLARRALAAVERTAGGRAVGAGSNGRIPLVEALNYPNRRVQYDAALAIGVSQPQATFSGAERVVPVLASTVRGATVQHAAVIANDAETYQSIRRVLQNLGYSVMPQGRTLGDLAAPIAEAPAVDLIVAAGLNAERFPALVSEVRGMAKLAATPVFGMSSPDAYLQLRNRYDTNSAVAVRQLGIGEEAMTVAMQELVNASAGGPITADEAREYTNRSLAALRDLAVSGNQFLNVADAALPLIGAIAETTGDTRLNIAEILSRVNQERCQRAVMDAALANAGADRVALMGKAAQSAKMFGNQLEARQVTRLVEIASGGPDDEATAAASLMGALGVANTELLPLILKGR